MRAVVGDRLHVHGRVVGTHDQTSEIIEVRGRDGEPPYLVRYGDGHETFVFPGGDASVEHPKREPPTHLKPAGLACSSRSSGWSPTG
jgi:hypothetical protein